MKKLLYVLVFAVMLSTPSRILAQAEDEMRSASLRFDEAVRLYETWKKSGNEEDAREAQKMFINLELEREGLIEEQRAEVRRCLNDLGDRVTPDAPLTAAPDAPPAAIEQLEREAASSDLKTQAWQTVAENMYRTGLRLRENNRLQEALKEFKGALLHNPNHTLARMAYKEVAALLGERDSDIEVRMEHIYEIAMVQRTLIQFEINHRYESAMEDLANERFVPATEKFQNVIKMIDHAPPDLDLGHKRQQAVMKLSEVATRKKEAEELEKYTQQEAARRLTDSLREQDELLTRRKISNLVKRADKHVTRKEYVQALKVLMTVQKLDPANPEIQLKMRKVKDDLYVHRRDRLTKFAERQAKFGEEMVLEATIPFGSDKKVIYYPQDWVQRIKNRKPDELSGVSQEVSQEDQELNNYLDTETVSPSFPNISLKDALLYFQQTKDVNIVYDTDIPVDDMRANMNAQNMRLRRAITLVLRQNDLTYRVRDGVLRVTTMENVKTDTVLRMYDIADLTGVVKNWNGPKIDITRVGDSVENVFAEDESTSGEGASADVYADFIRDNIKPSGGAADVDWGDEHKIIPHTNKLIVVTDAETHKKIQRLLETYRRARAVQVSVQVRIIEAQEYFFQDIGIDMDGLQQILGFGTAGLANNIASDLLYGTGTRTSGVMAAPKIYPIGTTMQYPLYVFMNPTTGQYTVSPPAYNYAYPGQNDAIAVDAQPGVNAFFQSQPNYMANWTRSYRYGMPLPPIAQNNWVDRGRLGVVDGQDILNIGNVVPVGVINAQEYVGMADNNKWNVSGGGTFLSPAAGALAAGQVVSRDSPFATTTAAGGGPLSANRSGINLAFTWLDDFQLGFVLRAVRASNKATILHAPTLTMYNGQRAYEFVGQHITYIESVDAQQAVGTQAYDPTPGDLFIGLSLEVKPTVSADKKYVQLEVNPDLTTLRLWRDPDVFVQGANNASNIEIPERDVQQLRSTVSVPDGGTLLIGGFINSWEKELEVSVPILRSIPILKHFFRRVTKSVEKRNIIFLVEPQIILQPEKEKEAMLQ